MKKVILLLILLFVSIQFHAQDFNKLKDLKLVKLEDYKKAEPEILKLTNFLYNTPVKPETDNRTLAMAYIIQWMTGTDYTFNIGERDVKLTKGTPDLLAMYMAALTKVAISNPDKKLSDDELYDAASKVLAEYCSKKENKLKPSKTLKKIIKKMKKS